MSNYINERELAENVNRAVYDYKAELESLRQQKNRQGASPTLGEEIDLYIRYIFPGGVRLMDHINPPPERPVVTMALMVGLSLEPLLQSIAYYQPRQVVPIVNRNYFATLDSRDMVKTVTQAIKTMTDVLTLDSMPKVLPHIEIQESSPGGVFQALLRLDPALYETDTSLEIPLLLDITGAKKSFTAGAYLFAAFSGLPVSYVDFEPEDYDPDRRQPRDFHVRFHVLKNPYQIFALRDWERLRLNYTRHNYRLAGEIAEDILHRTSNDPAQLLDATQREAIQKLVAVCRALEAWETGDYFQARALGQTIAGFRIPFAARQLAADWHHVDPELMPNEMLSKLFKRGLKLETGEETQDTLGDWGKSLYASPAKVMIYALDEIARIHRLHHNRGDYRSAYLRAAGLYEVLIMARIVGAWRHGDFVVVDEKEQTVDYLKVIPNALMACIGHTKHTPKHEGQVSVTSARALIPILRWSKKDAANRELRYANYRMYIPERQMEKFWNYAKDFDADLNEVESVNAAELIKDIGAFSDVRNKVVHTFLSIPADLSKAALRLARANLREYHQNWARIWVTSVPKTLASIQTWAKICTLCGLDFLPPNLKIDVEETIL
jgi:hypothetical protein